MIYFIAFDETAGSRKAYVVHAHTLTEAEELLMLELHGRDVTAHIKHFSWFRLNGGLELIP